MAEREIIKLGEEKVAEREKGKGGMEEKGKENMEGGKRKEETVRKGKGKREKDNKEKRILMRQNPRTTFPPSSLHVTTA